MSVCGYRYTSNKGRQNKKCQNPTPPRQPQTPTDPNHPLPTLTDQPMFDPVWTKPSPFWAILGKKLHYFDNLGMDGSVWVGFDEMARKVEIL